MNPHLFLHGSDLEKVPAGPTLCKASNTSLSTKHRAEDQRKPSQLSTSLFYQRALGKPSVRWQIAAMMTVFCYVVVWAGQLRGAASGLLNCTGAPFMLNVWYMVQIKHGMCVYLGVWVHMCVPVSAHICICSCRSQRTTSNVNLRNTIDYICSYLPAPTPAQLLHLNLLPFPPVTVAPQLLPASQEAA